MFIYVLFLFFSSPLIAEAHSTCLENKDIHLCQIVDDHEENAEHCYSCHFHYAISFENSKLNDFAKIPEAKIFFYRNLHRNILSYEIEYPPQFA